MGTDKALLEVGGSGMLGRTAGLLRPLVDDLFVVADDASPYADLGLPARADVHHGCGAIGGIHAALAHAAHPLVLCVACDMPHLQPALVELLLASADASADAVVPRVGGRFEPLLAVYGRGALPALERAIVAGRLRIMDALEGVRVRFLDEAALRGADAALRSFVNVNTPAELAAARAAAGPKAAPAAAGTHPRARLRAALQWRDGALAPVEVPVVREVAVSLRLNGREIITLLASDDALEFLAAGFLKAEGFVSRREDVRSIRVDPGGEAVDVEVDPAAIDPLAEKLLERRAVTSGCGKGTTFTHAIDALQARTAPPGPRVSAGQVRRLVHELLRGSELYRQAGGVHSAALATPESIVIFRDDIGRHNAVDKIHGECFLRQVPVDDKILLTTGRISSEILVKAAKLGVAVLVSRSSPTELALELAARTGITVIGQVRGGGLTIYAGAERVSA
jgi:FdhD protein